MPSTTRFTGPPEPPAGVLVLTLDLAAGRVALTGELDRATCGHLDASCRALAAETPPVWLLDLVVAARPFLRGLLSLTGLGDVLAPVARAIPRLPVGCAMGPPTVRAVGHARVDRVLGERARGARVDATKRRVVE